MDGPTHTSTDRRFRTDSVLIRVISALLVVLILPMRQLPWHALQAQTESATPHWTDALDDRLPGLMRRFGVPGVQVIVISGGRVAWRTAHGSADPATGRPMRLDTPMRVESITKPITAWGVLRLVQEGLLSLGDTVAYRVPEGVIPPATQAFTVRQLLSHTAGIGLGDFTARFAPDSAMPTVAEQVTREFSMPWAPGTGFHYSDTGYLLLELVMESVTGERFSSVMNREVLTPLGMEGATFDLTPAVLRNLAVGHSLRGEPVAPYAYPGLASGGLVATADDIARWLMAGADGAPRTVLTDMSMSLLHSPVTVPDPLFRLVADGYALGHFTETLSDGRTAVWHGGQGYGWMTHAHLVPSTGDGMVLLANSQRAWPLFARVLADWSTAIGVAPVGMARIRWGAPVGWVITGLLVMATLGAAATRPRNRRRVMIRAVLALVVVAGVVWVVTREYMFLFSVIPEIMNAMMAAGAALALALLISAWRGARRSIVVSGAGAAVSMITAATLMGAVSANAQERMTNTDRVVANLEVRSQPGTAVTEARSGPFTRATIAVWRAWTFLPWVFEREGTLLAGRLSASRVAIMPSPTDTSQPVWTEALYDVDAQLVAVRSIGATWEVSTLLAPGIASDLRGMDASHITLQGMMLLTRRSGDDRPSWGVGGAVTNASGDTRILPVISYERRGARGYLSVTAPVEATLAWSPSVAVEVRLLAELDGNAYRLGRQGLLNGGTIRYSAVDLGAGLGVRLSPWIRMTARAGMSLVRRLEAVNATGLVTEDASLARGWQFGVGLTAVRPGA